MLPQEPLPGASPAHDAFEKAARGAQRFTGLTVAVRHGKDSTSGTVLLQKEENNSQVKQCKACVCGKVLNMDMPPKHLMVLKRTACPETAKWVQLLWLVMQLEMANSLFFFPFFFF